MKKKKKKNYCETVSDVFIMYIVWGSWVKADIIFRYDDRCSHAKDMYISNIYNNLRQHLTTQLILMIFAKFSYS